MAGPDNVDDLSDDVTNNLNHFLEQATALREKWDSGRTKEECLEVLEKLNQQKNKFPIEKDYYEILERPVQLSALMTSLPDFIFEDRKIGSSELEGVSQILKAYLETNLTEGWCIMCSKLPEESVLLALSPRFVEKRNCIDRVVNQLKATPGNYSAILVPFFNEMRSRALDLRERCSSPELVEENDILFALWKIKRKIMATLGREQMLPVLRESEVLDFGALNNAVEAVEQSVQRETMENESSKALMTKLQTSAQHLLDVVHDNRNAIKSESHEFAKSVELVAVDMKVATQMLVDDIDKRIRIDSSRNQVASAICDFEVICAETVKKHKESHVAKERTKAEAQSDECFGTSSEC